MIATTLVCSTVVTRLLDPGGGMRSTECPNSLMHRVWTSIAERDLHVYKSDPVHIVTYNKPQSVLTAFNCTASVTVNAGHEQRHSLAGVALYIGAVNGASCVAVWPRPMMQLQRRDGTGRWWHLLGAGAGRTGCHRVRRRCRCPTACGFAAAYIRLRRRDRSIY